LHNGEDLEKMDKQLRAGNQQHDITKQIPQNKDQFDRRSAADHNSDGTGLIDIASFPSVGSKKGTVGYCLMRKNCVDLPNNPANFCVRPLRDRVDILDGGYRQNSGGHP